MIEELATRCYHCGDEIGRGPPPATGVFAGKEQVFCCTGCLGACRIIHEAGQASYYLQRESLPEGQTSLKSTFNKASAEFASYDIPGVLEKLTEAEPSGNLRKVILQIGGIHCQSCVVLNERLIERLPGIEDVHVSYETGRAEILFDPGKAPLSSVLERIRSIGYVPTVLAPGERTRLLKKEGRSLLWSIALSAFAAGNVMTLSFALWSGYFDGSISTEFRRLFEWLEFVFTTPVFFYAARTFHRGWKSFFRSGIPGMDVLISSGISAAYFYSVYAFFANTGGVYFDSVAMIVFFLLVGRYLEWRARLKQRERMESLIRPLPETCQKVLHEKSALSFQNGRPNTEETPLSKLRAGDLVWVCEGGVLPSDGVLLESPGMKNQGCEVDEAILTGESLPVERRPGDRMLAGSVVSRGDALVRLTAAVNKSGMAALSRLAEGVSQRLSSYESRTKTVIPYFSAVVLLVATLSLCVHYFWLEKSLHEAVVVAVAVLIVSCPCALALAVPTATSAALFLGVQKGILLRDGEVLENLSRLSHFLFDKTGTLTCGRPTVTAYELFADKNRIAQIIQIMEQGNQHPMGEALLEFARNQLNTLVFSKKAPTESSTKVPKNTSQIAFGEMPNDNTKPNVQYIGGQGLLLKTKEGEYKLGTLEFALPREKNLIQRFTELYKESTLIALSLNQKPLALFALEDRPRAEAPLVVRRLKRAGYEIHMLTGDSLGAARHVAAQIGIRFEHIHAGLTPADKLGLLRDLEKGQKNRHIAMVGDGYNDAPALAAAPVSIVLSRGAPLSLDYAGVILLTNHLGGIFTALEIARRAIGTIRLNLSISLLYNIVMISIAAAGLLLPIWCALAMALSSLSVIAASALFRLRGIPAV